MKHLAVIFFTLLLVACSADHKADRERARTLLSSYGCGSCHIIPGVAGANGHVGPPLNRVGRRGYIAGVLPNTRENMVRWIRVPEVVDPRTAMPNMGVTEDDAHIIADYLITLE